LEKERYSRIKPNNKFFHIIRRIMPNNDKKMKCLIIEDENHVKIRLLLSKWRGNRAKRKLGANLGEMRSKT